MITKARTSCFWNLSIARRLATTRLASSTTPNPPLDLDPSLKKLLKDVDISLVNYKFGKDASDSWSRTPSPRELEKFTGEHATEWSDLGSEADDYRDSEHGETRRSPAAHFGSQRIGAVILPDELQRSINLLISGADKSLLHTDAKRLFFAPDDSGHEESKWDADYNVQYRSRQQTARHAERDGTAFASVALPAHYSAIFSVLSHVKLRLEPDWKVQRVIDWGAGTGSALWASAHLFQMSVSRDNLPHDRRISDSSVMSYTGIDKREGLVSISKRLLKAVDIGKLDAKLQKAFRDNNKIHRADAQDVLAISAFTLSSLSSPLARKTLVKEMWESGANILILIDHNTTAGFESIAEARELVLSMGRKEMNDPSTETWPVRGSYVIAPCPHDGACPLYHPGSGKLTCGFSQRMQRPSFVRLTKHSGIGYEDIGYSYVAIRRGTRPLFSDIKVGRLGAVGQRALDNSASSQPPQELELHNDQESPEEYAADDEQIRLSQGSPVQTSSEPVSSVDVQEALRLESFHWPRLVFPPLKKSGHIILDACTSQGKIMRLTIPKSQGRQPYYDARKSSWGDLFPHEPKNSPQERYQPTRTKNAGRTAAARGNDTINGKRAFKERSSQTSYASLSDEVKEKKRKVRRDRVLAGDAHDSFW